MWVRVCPVFSPKFGSSESSAAPRVAEAVGSHGEEPGEVTLPGVQLALHSPAAARADVPVWHQHAQIQPGVCHGHLFQRALYFCVHLSNRSPRLS